MRRVVLGTLAMSVVTVVTTFSQLLLTPIGLRCWGPEHYGEWLTVSSLAGVFSLLELGVNTLSVNKMTACFARDDRDGFLHEMHSALRVQVPMAIALFGACAGGLVAIDASQMFAIKTSSRIDLSIALLALTTEIAQGFPAGLLAGAYRAMNRLPRGAGLSVVRSLGILAVTVVGFIAQHSFAWIAVGRLAVSVGVSVFILFDLAKVSGFIRLRPFVGSRRHGLSMIGPGILFLLVGLSDYLTGLALTVLLQKRMGGAEVAQFGTHRMLVNGSRLVAGALSAAVWPEIVQFDARNEPSRLRQAYESLTRTSGWMVGALAISIFALASPIYWLFTAKSLIVDPWLFGLLTADVILWGFWSPGATILQATNRQGRLVALLMFSSACSIALAFFLMRPFGLRGAALAIVLGNLSATSWLVPRVVCRCLGKAYAPQMLATLRTIFVSLLVPASLAYLGWLIVPSLVKPYVAVLVFAPCTLVGAWQILSPEERAAARKGLVRIRARLPV